MEEQTKKIKKTEWIPPLTGAAPRFYGNIVRTNWTLFDLTIMVGRLVSSGVEGAPFDSEHIASVTLAWPQVKVLATLLGQMVESFEKTNGEIKPLKLPPDPTAKPVEQDPEE